MANINEVLQDGQMLFEPRLQQYIEKKKYYKKYNIETESSLEREFNISKNDIRLIKDYTNGKKNCYNYEKKDQYLDLIDTTNQKFGGMDFKDDERYKRFQKKMERNKNATQQRHNYSSWDDGFSKIMPDDPVSAEDKKFDDRFFSIKKQPSMENPYKSNNGDSQRNIKYNDNNYSNKLYDNGPNNGQYAEKIIGNKKTYASEQNNRYEYENHLDFESKRNNHALNQNGKKYHNTASYTPIPHKSSNIIKNINIENNLRTGEDVDKSEYTKYRVNGKAKTVGYPNPTEHYYDYIYSNNITESVFPHPKNTRDDNHKAKNQIHKRDVM